MDSILNTREASEYLKCSVWTIYRIIKRNELTFSRKGQGLLFKAQDLEAWLDRDRTEARLNLKFYLTNKTVTNHLISEVSKLASGSIKSKTRPHYGYGSVYKRKKGKSWTMDFYDEDGKRIQKAVPQATCREEAVLALQQEIVKTFDRAHGIEEHREEKIGFRDFSKVYHEDYMKVTRRNFRPDIYRLQILCGYFGNVDLRIITPLEIERFRKSRLKAGNTKSTVNRYLQLLKKMFNLAIEEGYLEENVIRKVKLFSEKDNLKEQILTEKEERKLIENCSETLKSIITVALNTGMRRAEILNLTWNQVDFEARRIKVEKTKSGKVRFIPVNEILFNKLNRLKSENGQSPFVFFNPETKQPFLDMKTGFKTALKRAEIKGLRFHDLRHTFASRLVERGVDIETVRDLLGHHSILITQRYVHSNIDRKRNAVEILSKRTDKTGQDSDKMVTIENQSRLIS